MKHTNRFLLCAVALMGLVAVAFAADVTGTWTASFDTQVGKQNYTYTFKQTGTKLTGKAKSELAMSESEIAEGTVNGDDVSFVENLDYMGMPLRIVYKGKIAGDEIKFTRTILDMFMEDLVAKKSK
jgi:opacity protein-like surface antigen